MPHSPRRPCRMNGCPNLAEPGEQYCSAHKKQAEQFYNRYQRPTDRKKYGRALCPACATKEAAHA